MSASGKMARGARTGWCTTCGAECFNFRRHRCPPKIGKRTLAVCMAASTLRIAHVNVRTATVGTFNYDHLKKAEGLAFDALVSALDALNEGTDAGEET